MWSLGDAFFWQRPDPEPAPNSDPELIPRADRLLVRRLRALMRTDLEETDATLAAVRRAAVLPLLSGDGRQPGKGVPADLYEIANPAHWVAVDPRYLNVLAHLYQVDPDWVAGTAHTMTPYTTPPIRPQSAASAIHRPRLAAAAPLFSLLPLFLIVAVVAGVCVSETFFALQGPVLGVWAALLMIGLSAATLTGCAFLARHLWASLLPVLWPLPRLERALQTELRIQLAAQLPHYLPDSPALTVAELTAILAGSIPVDEELLTRLGGDYLSRRSILTEAAHALRTRRPGTSPTVCD